MTQSLQQPDRGERQRMEKKPNTTAQTGGLEQFDGGAKDFVIYQALLVFEHVGAPETTQVLADILVARTEDGDYDEKTEHWFFYSDGVDEVGNADAIDLVGGDELYWSEYSRSWTETVSGRLDNPVKMPMDVTYETPPAQAPGSCCFEHDDGSNVVGLGMELEIVNDACQGTVRWHRTDSSDGYITGPDSTLRLSRVTSAPSSIRTWERAF